jgi:hypothetical protein
MNTTERYSTTKGYWATAIPEPCPRLLVLSGEDEWSALYVDGKLYQVGDHYLIDERIRELTGVVTVHTEDFMRGQDTREGVAPDVEAVLRWTASREAAETQAADLREQARKLLEEAARMER